ncbi:MAG: hypothetical protein FWF52_05535 [Candidatus Azobacteroides sp.]|nr:hypothetical protein [Candidatus Azobacteroides sp.]
MISIIQQKVDRIAQCIFTKIQKSGKESFGLYSEDFGLLLFLFYYSRHSKNKKQVLLTERYAERLLEQLIGREKSHTFCSGFAGILYLFDHFWRIIWFIG